MRPNQASATAAWVAAARSVGVLLPQEMQLVRDPFGAQLADGLMGRLARYCLRYPSLGRRVTASGGALTAFLLWMQLRTRALDDILQRFTESGGEQLLLLGAGYDCRALRFAEGLAAGTVFEVDHPATQAKKRAFSSHERSAKVVYVSWDFEHQGTLALPAELERQGLRRDARTLTIWEGVTMYLPAAAVDQTVRAVADYSGRDSWFAVTYLDEQAIHRPRGDAKLTAAITSRVGEPYRFGFHPRTLPAWFEQRGFDMLSDETDGDLATRYVSAQAARRFPRCERHVALVKRR